MRTKLKKSLSILLTLVMLVGLLPTVAFAAETNKIEISADMPVIGCNYSGSLIGSFEVETDPSGNLPHNQHQLCFEWVEYDSVGTATGKTVDWSSTEVFKENHTYLPKVKDDSKSSYQVTDTTIIDFKNRDLALISSAKADGTPTNPGGDRIAPIQGYTLTIVDGNGYNDDHSGKFYPAGREIDICADEMKPTEQKVFKNWTSNNGGTFSNAEDCDTTFTMPAANVTVTANYETAEFYTLTLTDGSVSEDDAKYPAGYEVWIYANAESSATGEENYGFDKWQVLLGAAVLGDSESDSTSFIMPAENVSIKATYKAPTTISHIGLSNRSSFYIFNPVVGEAPMPHPGKAHFDIPVAKNFDNDPDCEIKWYKDSSTEEMTSSDTFEAGSSYKVEVTFKTAPGYVLADSLTGTVNGETATVTKIDARNGKISYTFAALPSTDPAKPTINTISASTYDGTEKDVTSSVQSFDSNTMYITGNKGTEAAEYTLSIRSKTGKWSGNTTDPVTATWRIAQKTPDASDFTFAAPPNLTYDGNVREATVTFDSSKYPTQTQGTIGIYYEKDGNEVSEPRDAGTYTVKINVFDFNNFQDAQNVTSNAWIFTISKAAAEAPSGLEGIKGKELSTVELPGGWTWVDGSQKMDTEGNQTFKANYVGTANYESQTNTDVEVNVKAKDDANVSIVNAPANKTYGDAEFELTATAANVGTGTGEWKWESSDPTVLEVTGANATATVKVKKANTTGATITVKYESDSTFGTATTAAIPVNKATITIKANDISAYVGDAAPMPTYTATGLVGSEALTTEPTLTYETAPDMSKAGTFKIKATDAVAPAGDNYSIEYVDGTLTVSARPSGGYVAPTYSIDTAKTENGSISVSPKSASKGKTVTINVTPDKGYELDELTVLDKNGKEIKLTAKDGKYTFTMPASKVTVKAIFDKVKENPNTGAFLFDDVKPGDYFYDAVLWALEKGITTGTSETTFSPNEPCTRGQIVTFLWRAAGSPEPKSAASFSDVAADAYYAKAVAWAVENGITSGTGDGKFSPDATCTRAQAVTFLSRALKGTAAAGSAFSDVAANSYYAEAVAWAVANDITKGTSATTFSPDADCTRGQIVTFLFRAMAE